jgi:imidazolonepropionase-like amidohydrolase
MRIKSKILILAISVLINTFGFSQESFVISNVRLFDGEIVKEKVNVLVSNGFISKITSKKISHKNNIDGIGKTLIPALTNSHVHVWSPLSLQQAAKAGVLNLLDMHAAEMLMPQMKGYNKFTNHADYYSAGSAATAPNGHGTQFGFPAPTLTKPEEALAFVKDRIKAGANYIKIIKEPWKAILDEPTVKALIEASHKENMKAVIHVSKVKDGYQVLKDKADGLVHIWDDKQLSEAQLIQLKDEYFFVIPTMLTIQKMRSINSKRTKEQFEAKMEMIRNEVKRLYDIGVPILAGTDPPNGNINYGTDLYKELELLKNAGISTLDVLKSATSLPAIHFNLKGKGFIKVGFRADLVLIDGNPTKNINDISNTKRVFKQGKEVK